MLKISRLETRFQEIVFLLTITFSLSVAVGGLFYLSLSPAGFVSATGSAGSALIQKGFVNFGYTYFFLVIFILHMGHLTLATANNVRDMLRSFPIYIRSFAIYFTVILLISSFLMVLQSYNQWPASSLLTQGHGGWFGSVIGGFLFRSFGLYGAMVLLFSMTSIIGIGAGYMEIVHSFYVMKDIFRDIGRNLKDNGPDVVRGLAQSFVEFLDQKPQFVGVPNPSSHEGRAGHSRSPSHLAYRSYSSQDLTPYSGRLVTDHFHMPEGDEPSFGSLPSDELSPDRANERSQVNGVQGKPESHEIERPLIHQPSPQAKRVVQSEPMVSESEKTKKKDNANKKTSEVEGLEDAPQALVNIKPWTKRYTKVEMALLEKPEKRSRKTDKEMIQICQSLAERLESFGIKGEVIAAHQGATLTMFEFMPAAGMKLSKIQSLSDDLALVLGAKSIRILAPIPGKTTVGIEVPNKEVATLRFSEMVNTCLKVKNMELPVPLGIDVYNKAHVNDLTKMPHLLVSGTTGSGKSVFMNSLISGLIFHKSPKELRFLMIDPKMIELSPYNGIPHLLKPVVTDVEEAKDLLLWAEAEMDRRYQIFSEMQAKNIISFNQSIKKSSKRSVEGRLGKKINWDFNEMPYIVIVIDELADLMLTQRNEVERPITRIAQKARAAGIHMVMATQRPSSDIVTGLIKTNFPTRVSFKVSSNVDSRTILDQPGAEKLLGNGDMLYMAQGKAIERLQGSYMSEDEVKKVVRSVSAQGGGSKGSKS
jgi:hypothetical protein